MAARMERTRYPGIFRRGGRYVATFRVNGKLRKETARTLTEARRLKAARTADVARGEFFEASRLRFAEYGREWIDRYQGRGRGFRESTREEYRRDLERAIKFLGERRRLAEIAPRDIANLVAWLCDEGEQGKRLSDSTIRNIVKPVRACLSTAVDEGLIRHNPAVRVHFPRREQVGEQDEVEEVRALTREQLRAFLGLVDRKHRTLFRFLAVTGLRISELVALQWRHVELGTRPHVKVRRQFYRGRLTPPKRDRKSVV